LNLEEDRTLPAASRESPGVRLHSHKIHLEVVQGPDTGVRVELPGPDIRIGSGRDCDLVLGDPTVSRLHLRLRVEKDAIRICDAGSRNGTRIDGVEIRDAYARPDSLIAIGSTVLRLRMLSGIIELPLSASDRFGRLLGQSVAMRRIFAVLERVAPAESTVLIEGETGTGKELAAAGIHEASPRSGGPFVVFDCSAVAQTLAESALFGHIKGAFTGATSDHPGVFEQAEGGTLFLDELGELPIELQPKLLRAIESREVLPLGAIRPRRVDVRIIAATNRSLAREVDRGRFREDLYYRLAVVTIRLPPLRERLEDVPLLVRHLAAEVAARLHPSIVPDSLQPEFILRAFGTQAWPGNVRELRNAVDRVLSFGRPTPAEAEAPPVPVEPLGVTLEEPLLAGRQRIADAYEKEYLTLALEKTGGNISRAAALAGVGRKFVQQAMRRHGLRGNPED
jgi:DNA-binding NtrC family response regulator